MRRSTAKGVEWGTTGSRESERLFADFRHTVLYRVNFEAAKICGFFVEARFGGACLDRAELSFSYFLSPTDQEMTFTSANLRVPSYGTPSFHRQAFIMRIAPALISLGAVSQM
jgi:hypothetical protein